MAPPGVSDMGGVWSRYAPHILMILAQLGYTLMYFITEAAFNRGLNPYVYVTYRHLLVAVLLWPFAYYHEKKLRPRMTFMLFMEIFVLSLLGVSLTLNMYFASLKYTSPTFVTSVVNTVASITFVIAIIFRMEIVDVKSLRGLAKIAGTVVSFAGVTTMTLYKGATITCLWKSPIHIHGDGGGVAHESWVKGSILAVASCICWSIWYIMQASSLKRYPAQLSLTAWMCTVGGIQSTIFTVFMQHKPEDWLIGFGVKFWSIVYAGLACNGFTVFVQLWCTEKKGPVFVTMFNPLSTIMVAILAYFIFGENLYVGSIIGGVVVILGLYMLLWGKEKDQEHGASKEQEFELDCEKQAKGIVMKFLVHVGGKFGGCSNRYSGGRVGCMTFMEPDGVDWYVMQENMVFHGYRGNARLYCLKPRYIPPEGLFFMLGEEQLQQLMKDHEGRKKNM